MSAANTEEIFAMYQGLLGAGRVHWAEPLPFTGRPGHHYFVRDADRRRFRQPARRASIMARISARTGAEAGLMRINQTYIVFVGSRAAATIQPTFLARDTESGIEAFEWIAHTHPLQLRDRYQDIAHGATESDRRVLAAVYACWGQDRSEVIVTRGTHVVAINAFQLTPDERTGQCRAE
ncbi:MAG: hypothetical protein SFV51_11645 [Bryobacteraceae bacterium]|nr:hypothetical protein [Bryobacteraceae bacterium]